MRSLAAAQSRIPAMCREAIERVRGIEQAVACLPQHYLDMHHVLHGGVYSRTGFLPAGVMATGAEIWVPTTVTICGDCTVTLGDLATRVTGYAVMAASAGRKQAFFAHADTYITMAFATQATTIEEAEDEFTHEAHLLMSRNPQTRNHVVVTGE